MADLTPQMENARTIARKNQTSRLYLLRELYNWGDGHPCVVHIEFLSDAPQWEEFDILDIAGYLEEEGLLVIGVDKQEGRLPMQHLCLTHKGIIEVERSIEYPTEATEHFPAPIVQYFNGPVGSVQSGQNNTSRAVQHLDKATKGAAHRRRTKGG